MRRVGQAIKNFFISLKTGIVRLRHFKPQQIPQILDNLSKKDVYIIFSALAACVLAGGFLFTQTFGYTGSGPHRGGTLTEGLVGQPQFINPVLSPTNSVDMDISRIVYAQLLKYDNQENLVPDLAAALPDVSADQKTYTLKLRPDLKWQDGQPLNADDVAYTIQTIQDQDFESPLRPNWARVKVTKVDDLTLTFTLREVSVSFINNFALGILPKHVWGDLSAHNFRLADANLKPVGDGPYKVAEIKKTADGTVKSINLVPNANYYQGRPYLDGVDFKFYDGYDTLISAYQGHAVDSLGFVPFDDKAFLATTDKYTQYRLSLPQYQAVFFNLQKSSPVAEKAVRQALWLTTDRDQIISEAYSSQAVPAYTPILPGSLGYNPDIEKTIHDSLSEAAGILDKAGWTLDPATNLRMKNVPKSGSTPATKKPLEFSLAVSGNLPLNVKAAQILQSQWQTLGAKIDLVIVSSDELEQNYIRPRTFDALLFSENTGPDPDPFAFWHSSQVHDPGLNLSGFADSQADKLLTDARQTTDSTVRATDYMQFQQIINDELPAIFLVRALYIYNVPKKIQGLNLTNIISPSERFADINQWYEQ